MLPVAATFRDIHVARTYYIYTMENASSSFASRFHLYIRCRSRTRTNNSTTELCARCLAIYHLIYTAYLVLCCSYLKPSRLNCFAISISFSRLQISNIVVLYVAIVSQPNSALIITSTHFPRPYTTTYLPYHVRRGQLVAIAGSEITLSPPAVLTGFDTVSFHSISLSVYFDAVSGLRPVSQNVCLLAGIVTTRPSAFVEGEGFEPPMFLRYSSLCEALCSIQRLIPFAFDHSANLPLLRLLRHDCIVTSFAGILKSLNFPSAIMCMILCSG